MADPDDGENTFRILVSTDNHLGFAEKDGIRGLDSIRTFEEILHLAQTKDVDFIFFAGDIFHESRPSMRIMHEAIRLLRTYCTGSKPVRFEFLSDPSSVFAETAFPEPNYLNPNLNIAIPVFAIHGNHDDPSGPDGLCAADLLHSAGLLNLFGKCSSVEQIEISPLLLRKGSTYLAIYGLGAMREERVHRLFSSNMVTFLHPKENADQWFSVCAVHQNRVRHGPTNYLPENFLPNFLDLVVWGHEHECRIEAEWNTTQNFYVIQPGSSIATALSEGESCDKAVALLEIKGKEFKATRLPLRSVRPLIFDDIALEDELPKTNGNALDLAKQVETTCVRLIEACIRRAADKRNGCLTQNNDDDAKDEDDRFATPKEPLIRLRLDLTGGFEAFSMLRFGQRFIGRVANPKDLITFNRNRENRAAAQARRALNFGVKDEPESQVTFPTDNKKLGLDAVMVENLVHRYLGGSTNDGLGLASLGSISRLDLFTAPELGKGLRRFVDHDSRDAILAVVDAVLGRTITHLRTRQTPEERIIPDIQSFSHSRRVSGNGAEDESDDTNEQQDESVATVATKINARRAGKTDNAVASSKRSRQPELDADDARWSSDDEHASSVSNASGRPKSRRQTRTKRPKMSLVFSDDDTRSDKTGNDDAADLIDTIESDESPPPKVVSTGRGRGSTRSRPGRSRRARGGRGL